VDIGRHFQRLSIDLLLKIGLGIVTNLGILGLLVQLS
jgi:hypothetical protein